MDNIKDDFYDEKYISINLFFGSFFSGRVVLLIYY